MTIRLFDDDPYQNEFIARVVRVLDNTVVLDRTCFYAESGGQPGDRGSIGGIPVIDAKYDADKASVLHVLQSPAGFCDTQEVNGIIDWQRRYRLMRLHSALHICYLVFNRIHGEHRLLGSSVAEDKARVDYEFFGTIDVQAISQSVNAIVGENVPIERYTKDLNNGLRFWRIPGYDEIPCGGTHPKRTGEIGSVSCKVKKQGKQGQRVYVSLEQP